MEENQELQGIDTNAELNTESETLNPITELTHIPYGTNPDGSTHWIKRDSEEFVTVIGKPDLLNKIAALILEIDKFADDFLESQVFYPVNGKVYKPKWADNSGTYWGLLQCDDTLIKRGQASLFPMVIKDATQLPENFVTMTRAELENLISFLILKIQENYNTKTAYIGELRQMQVRFADIVAYADYKIIFDRYNDIYNTLNKKGGDEWIEPTQDEILEENENSDTIEENQEISENEN